MLLGGFYFFFLLNLRIQGAACAESLEKEGKVPCSLFRQTEDFLMFAFTFFIIGIAYRE